MRSSHTRMPLCWRYVSTCLVMSAQVDELTVLPIRHDSGQCGNDSLKSFRLSKLTANCCSQDEWNQTSNCVKQEVDNGLKGAPAPKYRGIFFVSESLLCFHIYSFLSLLLACSCLDPPLLVATPAYMHHVIMTYLNCFTECLIMVSLYYGYYCFNYYHLH